MTCTMDLNNYDHDTYLAEEEDTERYAPAEINDALILGSESNDAPRVCVGDWLWVICQDESGWTFASTTEGWCGWYPTSYLESVGEEGEATEQAELNTRSEGENWDWNDGIEEGAYPVSSYAWDENPDGSEQDGYRDTKALLFMCNEESRTFRRRSKTVPCINEKESHLYPRVSLL